MKQSMKWLADLILLLVITVLAGFMLFPRSRKTVSFNYQPIPNNEIESQAQEQKAQKRLAKPREIAAFFGWGEKKTDVIEETAHVSVEKEPLPAEATWLKPIGFIGEEKGSRSYLFKDSNTGKILSLALGVESKGWKLLEVTSEQFLLEFDGKKYIIKQNE